MTYLRPRSISVGARRTTVRLEEDFWDELMRISERSGISVGQLCGLIKSTGPSNLSSAIRVFVLREALLKTREQRGGHGKDLR